MNKICVIKAGSAVITQKDGMLDVDTLGNLCLQIAIVHEKGWKPVLVTSGAVASGRGVMGGAERAGGKATSSRSLASVGQSRLLSFYTDMLESYKMPLKSGQVLLTREAFSVRERYTALRDTLKEMIAADILPIINNNDVINVSNLDFTDNDQLASYVAGMLDADILVLLSDIDGVYNANPKTNSDAQRIVRLDGQIEKWPAIEIDDSLSSAGGMKSKLAALKLMASLGIACCIGRGRQNDILIKLLLEDNHDVGTYLPSRSFDKDDDGATDTYRRWLATGASPTATILVSNIGSDALRREGHRASLLAAGIENIYGKFEQDAIVAVRDEEFTLLGIGRTKFASSELRESAKSEDVVVIHADFFLGVSRSHIANTEKPAIVSFASQLRNRKYKCVANSRNGISIFNPDDREGRATRKIVGDEGTKAYRVAKLASRKLNVKIEDWVLYSLMGSGSEVRTSATIPGVVRHGK